MPRLPTANPAAVAFRHGQIRHLFRALRQSVGTLRTQVAPLSQFLADVMHHAFDRLGRHTLPCGIGHRLLGALKRTRLGCDYHCSPDE